MTPIHALLDILGLAVVFFTAPLLLELLTLSLAALLNPRRPPTAANPAFRLAIIIPAHNEERLIATCVHSLLISKNPAVQVNVVAHNCTDTTAAAAEAAGAHVLVLNDTTGGKGSALHYGFTHALNAGANAVLVIDADSIVSPNLVYEVSSALAAGSQALQCRYEVANPGATRRTRLMALSFLGMNVLRPRGRSRLGLSCGIFGNGFALTAATLQRVPYVANSVVEDLEYHLHLLRAGIRVDFLDSATVFGEMPDSNAASATQRARWEGGRLLMRRQFSWPLLREVLTGRFALIEPLLDLRALPLATEAALLLLALLPPLIWLRVYAACGLAAVLLYVVTAASLGPSPLRTLQAVATVPGYLLWKIAMIPGTRLAARKDSVWIRTKRNDTPPQ